MMALPPSRRSRGQRRLTLSVGFRRLVVGTPGRQRQRCCATPGPGRIASRRASPAPHLTGPAPRVQAFRPPSPPRGTAPPPRPRSASYPINGVRVRRVARNGRLGRQPCIAAGSRTASALLAARCRELGGDCRMRVPTRNRVFARVRSCPAGDGALPHCCVARAMAQTARCRPDQQRVRGHPRLAQLLAKRQAAHRDPKRAGRAGSPQARLNGGCDASVRARPSLRCARWVRVTLPRFSGWSSGHPRSVVARLPDDVRPEEAREHTVRNPKGEEVRAVEPTLGVQQPGYHKRPRF